MGNEDHATLCVAEDSDRRAIGRVRSASIIRAKAIEHTDMQVVAFIFILLMLLGLLILAAASRRQARLLREQREAEGSIPREEETG